MHHVRSVLALTDKILNEKKIIITTTYFLNVMAFYLIVDLRFFILTVRLSQRKWLLNHTNRWAMLVAIPEHTYTAYVGNAIWDSPEIDHSYRASHSIPKWLIAFNNFESVLTPSFYCGWLIVMMKIHVYFSKFSLKTFIYSVVDVLSLDILLQNYFAEFILFANNMVRNV